tara:strand:+ start:783 stop:1556 length:774 start_codon:yes stop_codon:yes gene_type:complete
MSPTPEYDPEATPFFFSGAALDDIAEQHGGSYANADPFPHAVIDDFLPEDVAEEVLAEFPDARNDEWIHRPPDHKYQQRKLKHYDEQTMGPVVRNVLSQFNSAAMIEFLEKVTGIDGLIPDPYYWGGGMHLIERGGFLKVHADFNWHEKLRLDRRVNLLLYFNKEWDESYGGHLELWNREMSSCVKRVLPVFNRCVIFNTTDTSFHGHPDPIACPEGRNRKSLALYYYSNGRPASESAGKSRTTYKLRPGESPYTPS